MKPIITLENKIAEASRDLLSIKHADEYGYIKTRLVMGLIAVCWTCEAKNDPLMPVVIQIHNLISMSKDFDDFFQNLIYADEVLRKVKFNLEKSFSS